MNKRTSTWKWVLNILAVFYKCKHRVTREIKSSTKIIIIPFFFLFHLSNAAIWYTNISNFIFFISSSFRQLLISHNENYVQLRSLEGMNLTQTISQCFFSLHQTAITRYADFKLLLARQIIVIIQKAYISWSTKNEIFHSFWFWINNYSRFEITSVWSWDLFTYITYGLQKLQKFYKTLSPKSSFLMTYLEIILTLE